jgi:hypothetical protein
MEAWTTWKSKSYRSLISVKWFHVIGAFDFNEDNRIAAATVIKKFWKGWQVRINYRFSPYNRLGAYLIMREFEKALRE